MSGSPEPDHPLPLRLKAFFSELRRRKVVRAAAAYLVVAWVFVEVMELVLDTFNVSEVVMQVILGAVVALLPVVMIMSWLFDLTTKGLVRTAAAEVEEVDDEPVTVSKRRQMTMLSASIRVEAVGEIDPEDLMELQPAAMKVARAVCRRFGGRLLAGHGSEVLAYFGYPLAAEDDTLRAVRAALGLVEGIDRLERQKNESLNVKIASHAAVHTGEVITEETDLDGDGEPDIFGVLPGAATALMKLGEADQVLITAEAQDIVRGYFDVASIGAQDLGQGGEPRKAYLVLAESGARNRLEAQGTAALTPLAGREHELGMLTADWNRALASEGVAVLITGGPGIGKSRLVHAVSELAAERPDAALLKLYCQTQYSNSALFPFIDYLRRDALRLDRFDDDAQRLEQVEGLLAEYNQDLQDMVPLLADLLQLPLSDKYLPSAFSPQQKRKATMDLLIDLLLEQAAKQPVLFIVEDLHWADPTSLELIDQLAGELSGTGMLAVLTARAPFEAPPAANAAVHRISLAGVDAQAAAAICEALGETLPGPALARIADKADGVPLYLEELTRAVVESGAFKGELSPSELKRRVEELIPATVQDALTARLDHAGKARKVASIGATIGREFSGALIERLAGRLRVRKLEDKLDQLVQAEILYRRGRGDRITYKFKHALLQDAAYKQLVRKERARFHREVADVLGSDFPALAKSQPELLALHYTRADRGEQAIPFWLEAGRKATRSSADHEAMAHFEQGMALLDEVSSEPQRLQLELELQTAMGPSLMATFGYSAEEVQRTFARARELCDQVGDTPRLVPVLGGLWAYYQVRASLELALVTATRLRKLADELHSVDLELEAELFLGVTSLHIGRFADCERHTRRVLELYDPEAHAGHAYVYGQDPGMAARVYLADALWMQGDADGALAMARAGIEHARKMKHPHSLAFALAIAARMICRQDEIALTREWALEARAIAHRYGFPVWETMSMILLAWADAREHGGGDGPERMQQVLDIYAKKGTLISNPYYLSLLADLRSEQGEHAVALDLLDRAMDPSYAEDRQADPEVLRVRGEVLSRRGDAGDEDAAEASLRSSIEQARAMGAGGWAQKSARTLARLLEARGQPNAARDVLEATTGALADKASGPLDEANRTTV